MPSSGPFFVVQLSSWRTCFSKVLHVSAPYIVMDYPFFFAGARQIFINYHTVSLLHNQCQCCARSFLDFVMLHD